MKIGYSFWGFLGPGITDTPDGGRSHRRPLAPLPDSDEPANRTGHDDAGAGDEELPFVDTRLHEVVVLGAPYDSGELVLGTTDRAGHPITIRSAGPVRIPRTGRKPSWTPPPPRTPAPTARIRGSGPVRNASLQTPTPTGRPLLRRGTGLVARTTGRQQRVRAPSSRPA